MKKVLYYIILIILLSCWGIIFTHQGQLQGAVQHYVQKVIPPCGKPLEYSLGRVDPKFGLSQEDLQNTILEAEKIWEEPVGKNLFQYNPAAKLKINLIFDERQAGTLEAEEIEQSLNQLELSHDALTKQYQNLSGSYNKRLEAYNKSVADYEKRLKKYNKDVDYWNSQGGAPADEYDKLQKEKKALKNILDDLEKERKAINQLAGKTNALATEENKIVSNYNSVVDTYKNKYGSAREFEKGIFDGQNINIYQFKEKADLRLTIVHEFGHALGIGHLSSPQSIMYYLMSDQNMDNPKLTEEDLTALKSVCKL